MMGIFSFFFPFFFSLFFLVLFLATHGNVYDKPKNDIPFPYFLFLPPSSIPASNFYTLGQVGWLYHHHPHHHHQHSSIFTLLCYVMYTSICMSMFCKLWNFLFSFFLFLSSFFLYQKTFLFPSSFSSCSSIFLLIGTAWYGMAYFCIIGLFVWVMGLVGLVWLFDDLVCLFFWEGWGSGELWWVSR